MKLICRTSGRRSHSNWRTRWEPGRQPPRLRACQLLTRKRWSSKLPRLTSNCSPCPLPGLPKMKRWRVILFSRTSRRNLDRSLRPSQIRLKLRTRKRQKRHTVPPPGPLRPPTGVPRRLARRAARWQGPPWRPLRRISFRTGRSQQRGRRSRDPLQPWDCLPRNGFAGRSDQRIPEGRRRGR